MSQAAPPHVTAAAAALLLALALAAPARGNPVSAFGGEGGTVFPLTSREVELVSEHVVLRGVAGPPRGWDVRGEYLLRNTAARELSLELAFPVFDHHHIKGDLTSGKPLPPSWTAVSSIQVLVDGKPAPVRRVRLAHSRMVTSGFGWRARLPARAEVKLQVSYRHGALEGGPVHTPWGGTRKLYLDRVQASYVLTTGQRWRGGRIGRALLEVIPGEPFVVEGARDIALPGSRVVGRGVTQKLVWDLAAFEPKEDLSVYLVLASRATTAAVESYLAPLRTEEETQTGRLPPPEWDLLQLPDRELDRAAELVQVAHGVVPADATRRAALAQEWWYVPDPRARPRFSPEERQLLRLTERERHRRKNGAGRPGQPDAACARRAPLDRLLCALRGGDANLRRAAQRALARVSAADLPALLQALADPDELVREEAAAALGRLGRAAAPALPRLLRLAGSDRPSVQLAALDAAARLGEPVRTPPASALLRRLLEGRDPDLQLAAAAAVAALGVLAPERPAVEKRLLQLLAPGHERPLRLESARALGRLGEEAPSEAALAAVRAVRQVPPAVRQGLLGEPDELREVCLDAIARMAKRSDSALAALLELGRHGEDTAAVLGHLGRLGQRAAGTLPILRRELRSRSRDRRLAAARALTMLGHGAETLPVWLDLLRQAPPGDPAHEVSLEELGDRVSFLVPGLLRLAGQHVDVSGQLGALALRDARALDALTRALKSRNRSLRSGAEYYHLHKLAGQTPRVVPALLGLLGSPDASTRTNAASALARVSPAEASTVLPALERLTEDRDEEVRRSVSLALFSLGKPERASRRWREWLRSTVSYYRREALTEIRRLGPRAGAMLPELLSRLGDREEDVAVAAVEAIGALGSSGLGAAPRLAALFVERRPRVRMAALLALDGLQRPRTAASPR